MEELNKLLQAQFEKMCATGKLFKSSFTGRQTWDLYLESFKDGDNPVFRDPESTTYNCNHCNNFIRRYGNVVAVDENFEIITLFDVIADEEYQASVDAMSRALKSAPIANIFFETFNELTKLPYDACKKTDATFRLGTARNHKRYTPEEAKLYGVVKAGETRTFHHFHLDLPKAFVDMTGNSVESIQAEYKSAKDVFLRSMVEIPMDTLDLVIDLINQGSLLNGATHVSKVILMKRFKEMFTETGAGKRNTWAWVVSYKLAIAKFKNELIGVLCTELAEGEELNKACQSWNKRVDPANYMKAVAPITETQKKNAQTFVEENGYVESFDRRLASLDDIKVNEILHSNVGDGKVKAVSLFDSVKTTPSRHKRNEFKGIEEVSIDKFMKDILPGCASVEAFVENRHEGNLVTMTTSKEEDCKQMFKWDNPYSWTYKGNLAGKSQIKENVSKVGGNIVALVRCSLQWNDKDTPGVVDFDLHSKGSNHIYHSNNGSTHSCGGMLDTDMIRPSKIGIENITWKNKIKDGVYNLGVKNYCGGKNTGFKVEIEFGDEVFNYSVNKEAKGFIEIATLTVKDGVISIVHHLSESSSSKDIYGLETQQFHKVNLMCLSPNHWGANKTGNKHYFFMMDKCNADTSLRSFHSENLDPELAKHRKVLEVLGAVNMLEPTGKQLSGLGFNATVKDEVILRLTGNFKRVIRVRF